MIIALTRIRNEELIISDSLRHMAEFADGIIVYDDASTDRTVEIVKSSNAPVLEILEGSKWSRDRQAAETQHRSILMHRTSCYDATWLVYLDADERFAGDLREELGMHSPQVHALRFPLLDAYLSPFGREPYKDGDLSSLHRLYGPEVRHILMAWRPSQKIKYLGNDQREPVLGLSRRVVESTLPVKHFGKAISLAQWEETCSYYESNFPEPYKSKWAARKGRGIHTYSDFQNPLMEWPIPEEQRIDIDPPARRSTFVKQLWLELPRL